MYDQSKLKKITCHSVNDRSGTRANVATDSPEQVSTGEDPPLGVVCPSRSGYVRICNSLALYSLSILTEGAF